MSYVRELRDGGGFLVRKHRARHAEAYGPTEMIGQSVNDEEERNRTNDNTMKNVFAISIYNYIRE